MRRVGIALALVVVAGCATWPPTWPFGPASSLLVEADRLARDGDYQGAVDLYDELLGRYPDDPSAHRALETRDTLAAILIARAELARLRQEVARLQEELTRREGDLSRVRAELNARQTEAEQLRADLERLKEQDLREQRRRK